MRLDLAIASRFPDVSRRRARLLLSAHRILVNDRVVSVASREVKESDRLVIADEVAPIEVLARSSDWVAVNKPAALAVQPMRDRDQRSLLERLQVQARQEGRSPDLFVVHRIDTNTTGVVLFATTSAAAARFSALFASGEIEKTYLAVVSGIIREPMVIETPVGGKSARTAITPVSSNATTTVLEVALGTGRKHQIRIHLSELGHPVAGDRRYGSQMRAPRPLLHAWRLAHPSIGVVTAPVPDDLIRSSPPLGERWTTR